MRVSEVASTTGEAQHDRASHRSSVGKAGNEELLPVLLVMLDRHMRANGFAQDNGRMFTRTDAVDRRFHGCFALVAVRGNIMFAAPF
jgi:hypothetical protein